MSKVSRAVKVAADLFPVLPKLTSNCIKCHFHRFAWQHSQLTLIQEIHKKADFGRVLKSSGLKPSNYALWWYGQMLPWPLKPICIIRFLLTVQQDEHQCTWEPAMSWVSLRCSIKSRLSKLTNPTWRNQCINFESNKTDIRVLESPPWVCLRSWRRVVSSVDAGKSRSKMKHKSMKAQVLKSTAT